MKLLVVTAAALLAAASFASVSAAVVDPVGYAETYCRLRRSGRTVQDSIRVAVNSNIDHSRTAVQVDGRDLDVRLSEAGASLLCPDY